MRVKALQDWCVAQEGVVTCVKKHNTNLKNEQKQYKEAFHSLNGELKEVREGEVGGRESTEGEAGRRAVGVDTVRGRRNHSFTPVLNIMALGLRIALNRLRLSTLTWIYLGLPWMILCRRHLLATPLLARVTTLLS